MKKYLKFLSVAVLTMSAVFISSCGDDDGGGGSEIPPALVKTLLIVYDSDYEALYEFTYDVDDRLIMTEVTEDCCDPYTITYDYSVANQLTEDEDGFETVFVLDGEGRIIKELWNPPATDDDFTGYEYDADGFMIRIYEKEDGVETTKETATVASDNITVHTRFSGGVSNRTKVFTYLPSATALNVSNLPQANLRNSERRTISGLYGKGSKKLVDFLELNYVGAPDDYVKNSNAYTFDANNRVLTVTRTGVDVDGIDTGLDEVFTYTYYED